MTSPNDINDFFADCTDFDLCDALSVVLENHYGFDELLKRAAHIPHERWVIHNIWSNSGFLDGEGHSYFWGSQLDHRGYAEALEEIGFPIEASIIRDAIALVPPELLGDWNAVEDHTKSEKGRDEAAELMDEKLISDHPDFSRTLGRYVRDRRHSFADLLDALKRQRQYIEGLS
jgi:hypothetical protein